MATRDTREAAQAMIDFMQSKRPAAQFKIVERAEKWGAEFTVYERGICTKCGAEIWHIDYANPRVAHANCEIAAQKQREDESRIRSTNEQIKTAQMAARDRWEES